MQANGIIGDPFYRFNEVKQAWISNYTWVYTTKFDIMADKLFDLHIVFEAVDTIAEIKLNDIVIGKTTNEFVYYVFELDEETLKIRGNILEISIESSLKYAKWQNYSYPYEVPQTENYNVWAEPSNRQFIRKTGSDFGWDWGPSLIPIGIPGRIYIPYWDYGTLFNPIIH